MATNDTLKSHILINGGIKTNETKAYPREFYLDLSEGKNELFVGDPGQESESPTLSTLKPLKVGTSGEALDVNFVGTDEDIYDIYGPAETTDIAEVRPSLVTTPTDKVPSTGVNNGVSIGFKAPQINGFYARHLLASRILFPHAFVKGDENAWNHKIGFNVYSDSNENGYLHVEMGERGIFNRGTIQNSFTNNLATLNCSVGSSTNTTTQRQQGIILTETQFNDNKDKYRPGDVVIII